MDLFEEKKFTVAKSREKFLLECDVCRTQFLRDKKHIDEGRRLNRTHCCSKKCASILNKKSRGFEEPKTLKCKQCGQQFERKTCEVRKSKNHFCSQSCSATYSNTHKTTGTRRSKLEIWLEARLPTLYPNLEFKFNSKEEINSELDIYIPSLKLAFELNGIFHYEPIYGQDKLDQIQNNDERKFQACAENGISLCVIDTSSQKYFKESSSKRFLKIISGIIEENHQDAGI